MNNNFSGEANNSQPKNAGNAAPTQKNIRTSARSGVLSNENIISLFVKGDEKFVYNQELQVERQINLAILKTSQGEIIGIIKTDKKDRQALIKQKQNKHLEKIQEALTENCFVHLGYSKTKLGFIEYKQYPVPEGYQINYTTAKILWKIWWPSQNFSNQNKIQLNILVYTRDQWYPIKDIIVHEGKLYIRTLVEEIKLEGEDKITWVNKLEKEENKLTIQQQSKLEQNATVAKRYSLIQKAIDDRGVFAEPQALEQQSNNEREKKNTSSERERSDKDIVKQILAINESMNKMRIEHQKQIVDLQRKQEEEFKKLRQQLLFLSKNIAGVEAKSFEQTLPETSTPNNRKPVIERSVAESPLEEADTNDEQEPASPKLLQNLVNWLEKRS